MFSMLLKGKTEVSFRTLVFNERFERSRVLKVNYNHFGFDYMLLHGFPRIFTRGDTMLFFNEKTLVFGPLTPFYCFAPPRLQFGSPHITTGPSTLLPLPGSSSRTPEDLVVSFLL